MADTPQFDPIAQYRQQYQDPRSDQEIGQKLLDPQNFQKAFPQYDYSSPDATQRISAHMQSYYNTKFPATTPGTTSPQDVPTMRAYTPGIMERIGNVLAPLKEHLSLTQSAPYKDPRLIAPEAAMTPLEQQAHPIATATGEFAGGLTTGENLSMML